MAETDARSTDDRSEGMLFVVLGGMFTTLGLTVGSDLGSFATYGFLLAGVALAFAGLLRAR